MIPTSDPAHTIPDGSMKSDITLVAGNLFTGTVLSFSQLLNRKKTENRINPNTLKESDISNNLTYNISPIS